MHREMLTQHNGRIFRHRALYLFDPHPSLARFPLALAINGPLVKAGTIQPGEFADAFPPRFAQLEDRWFLVGSRLAWHYRLTYGPGRFPAEFCDPVDCPDDAAVQVFAAEDLARYGTLRDAAGPRLNSRVTDNKSKHLDAEQMCPVCVVAEWSTRGIHPRKVPLTAAAGKGWRGVEGRGQGGSVVCGRCGFQLRLTATDYSLFCHKALPIAPIIGPHYVPDPESPDGCAIEYCDVCRGVGRRGIILERKYPDGWIEIECSHCPPGHSQYAGARDWQHAPWWGGVRRFAADVDQAA